MYVYSRPRQTKTTQGSLVGAVVLATYNIITYGHYTPVSLQTLFLAPWHPSASAHKIQHPKGAKALRKASVARLIIPYYIRDIQR